MAPLTKPRVVWDLEFALRGCPILLYTPAGPGMLGTAVDVLGFLCVVTLPLHAIGEFAFSSLTSCFEGSFQLKTVGG